MMAISLRLGIVLFIAVFSKAKANEDTVRLKDQQFITKDIETRIINGEEAARGQFPYMVGMYLNEVDFCGGAFISSQWVLTAAHCLVDNNLLTVFLGGHELNLPSEPGRIVLNSRKKLIHEKYTPKLSDNDVGLVKLPIEIQPDNHISIIPLPPRSFNNRDFVGQTVRLSGWGLLKDDDRWISNKLQFADVTIISNEKCKENYGERITDRIVCTSPEKSACHGDSGSPLVIIDKESNKTVHFAIVSFGGSATGCSGAITAFDRTYKFLDWINAKTGIPIEN